MKDLGDFQTPPQLVELILDRLQRDGVEWARVLEPTSGTGSFVSGVLERRPDSEVVAVELQERYGAEEGPRNVRVVHGSIFDTDLSAIGWRKKGQLLVIGNPPWVTSAQLGALGSTNVPRKENLKGLAGLAAKTGEANFDLTEYIWLKLIKELQDGAFIALLCKTSVARNVFQYLHQSRIGVRRAAMCRIDARRWFGVAVDACLLYVALDRTCAPPTDLDVYADLAELHPVTRMGFVKGRLVADVAAYQKVADLDGTSQFEWRQGLKHDAAKVMELTYRDGALTNGFGELADVEEEHVYPLMKGTDVYRAADTEPSLRRVVVPQRKLGEDTTGLSASAPRLWAYLQTYRAIFDRRKSSIYRGRQPYSIFGIGDYSFAPYKVAVSGLHKTPRFVVVGPVDGRPVMFDDTCYFLAFDSAREASDVHALVGSQPARLLMEALIFTDAKRPVTKKLLQRIDLGRVADRLRSEATTGEVRTSALTVA